MNDGYAVDRTPSGSWRIVQPSGEPWNDEWFSLKREAVAYLRAYDIAAEIAARAERERQHQVEHARYIARHNHPEYQALHYLSVLRDRFVETAKAADGYAERFPAHADPFRVAARKAQYAALDLNLTVRNLNARIDTDLAGKE